MTNFARRFSRGAAAPWRGIRFVSKNPSLLGRFAIPVLINAVVYIAGFWLFFTNLSSLLHALFHDPQTWWMKTLFYLAGFFIGAVFSLVMVFTFTAVGLIVASPFLEAISRRVDEIRKGLDPASAEGSILGGIVISLFSQAKKIVLFLLIQGACLLLYFIPVAGQAVGTVLQAIVAFFFLAWEFWDFPMDRRRMDFAAKRAFLKTHAATALGFGAVCFLYILVPLLNFVMMPMSVAGATILVSELLEEV